MKLSIYLILYILSSFATIPFSQTKKPNILFLSIDDLRPELGCYGNTKISTPNLDVFSSTASMMTGLRSDSNDL
jgi:hypothetical protein